MARLWQSGFELNSTTNGMEWSSKTGTPTIQTSIVRSGTYAGRTNPSASTQAFTEDFLPSGGSTNNLYFRAYIYIASAPNAAINIINTRDVAAAVNVVAMRLNTDRTVTFMDAGNVTSIGSNSSALALNTWYRLEIEYQYHATTPTVIGYVDGSSFASGTLVNNANNNPSQLTLGSIVSVTTDLYWDDVAINDSTSPGPASLPGSGKIVHLHPNAAGDNAQWAVGAGAGANYTLVNEVTPNDATSYVQSRTTSEIDDYDIDAFPGSSTDIINVVAVGYRANRSAGTVSSSVVPRLKASASGTVDEGIVETASTTSWRTNDLDTNSAAPFGLVDYVKPGTSSVWTPSDVDSAQIGVRTQSGSGDRYVQVTNIWLSVDYTPNTAFLVNVSDTVTVTESSNTAISGTLTINTSDTVTTSESVTMFTNKLYLSTSDTVTTTESVGMFTNKLYLSTSDTVTASETMSVSVPPIGLISTQVSENVTTSESVNVSIQPVVARNISVSDTVTITENTTIKAMRVGLWVWDFLSNVVTSTSEQNILLNECINTGITDLYCYSFASSVTSNATAIRTFIARCTELKIRVWGLEGDRAYFSDADGPSQLSATVTALSNYNSGSTADQKFYGLHLDMEPPDSGGYTTFHNGIASSALSTTPSSGVWQSTQALDREYLMRDWIQIHKDLTTSLTAASMYLATAVPTWFDDYFGEPITCTFDSISQNVYLHLANYSSNIAVMSYNTTPATVVSRISYEFGQSITPYFGFSVETHTGVGSGISYGDTVGKQTKAAVLADRTTIDASYTGTSHYTHFNIHDWVGWKALSPASTNTTDPLVEPSVSDSATTSESVAVSIASLAARSVNVSDTVTTSEASTAKPVTSTNVSDTITTSESVTVSPRTFSISVSDTVTTSESVALLIPTIYLSTSDTVTTTESNGVSAPPVGSTTIFTSDSTIISESVALLVSNLVVNVSDSVTVTENKIASKVTGVNKSDSVTVTESVALFIQSLYITTSDLTLVSENVSVTKELGVGSLVDLEVTLEGASMNLVLSSEPNSVTINSESTDLTIEGQSTSVILEA